MSILGGMDMLGWILGLFILTDFFLFFKTSILQLEMVEHLKVRQDCYKIENHYFQFIHKIKKK